MPHGKLLLVDDEPALLRLMERYLGRMGYEVTPCRRAGEALTRFEESGAGFDLLIVDLGLPDIPGETLLKKLREANPALRAIICSGSPPPPAGELPGVAFLQKPFVPAMLADTVERVLGDSEAG
jgi:DNA-binding NtrC family response regulator